MTFRTLKSRDAEVLRSFWEGIPGLGLGPSDRPEALDGFFRRNPDLSWGAYDGESLVATLLAGHDGRRGFLYHLAVAGSHRRRGLSTELLHRALEGLAGCGISKVHAFVLADNTPGLAFWAAASRQGWGHRGDLILYSKNLETTTAP